MNKKILAIGATSAVAAAMPVLGVFAATTRTDTVRVTVEKGCTFTSDATDGVDRAVTIAQGGVLQDIEGVTFTILCNSENENGTWEISAVGEDSAKMQDGVGNSFASTASELDGSTSNWQFKLTTTGDAKAEGTYSNYSQIPASSTKVASNVAASAQDNATISALYGVSISKEQTPGTYTGRVTYTLTNQAGD